MDTGSSKTDVTINERIISRIYTIIRSFFYQIAQHTFEKIPDNQKEKKATNVIKRYRDQSTFSGVCWGIVGVAASILPRPESNLRFYYGIWIVVTFVYVGILIISRMEMGIWQEILDTFKLVRTDALDLENKQLKETIEVLNSKIAVVQKDRNRLMEIKSVTALVETKRKQGKQDDIQNMLILRILTNLGPGEYSVALYHSYDKEYILDEYESNRDNREYPSLYKRVINRQDKKYRRHYSNKCLFSEDKGMHCFSSKTEVAQNLKGDISDINQYANYCFSMGGHRLLLEIIAYKNTTFSCTDINDYFKNLFDTYIPILELFLDLDKGVKAMKSDISKMNSKEGA